MKKYIFTQKFLILIVIILIILIGFIFVINDFFVDTKSFNKEFSPNKQYYVQVVEKNAGATTEYYSVVRVGNAKSIFTNLGILSAWTGNRHGIFAYNGTQNSVKPSWVDSRTLKIEYSNCTATYAKENFWKDIKIVYEGQCAHN